MIKTVISSASDDVTSENMAEDNIDTQADNIEATDDLVTGEDVPIERNNYISDDDRVEYPKKCGRTEVCFNIQRPANDGTFYKIT